MSQTDIDGAILTGADGFLQILNRMFLAAKGSALLVMQPAKLLQNLGVIWVSVENPPIRRLCGIVLERVSKQCPISGRTGLHLFAARAHGRFGTICPLR